MPTQPTGTCIYMYTYIYIYMYMYMYIHPREGQAFMETTCNVAFISFLYVVCEICSTHEDTHSG